MNPSVRIYAYDDPVKFLSAELKRRKIEYKGFSLREWARTLGYENPSFLSDVLKGRRKLKLSLAVIIAANLKLDEKATRYFELLVLISQTKEVKEKRHLNKLLHSMRPAEMENITPTSFENFDLIADWHNWAILEMVQMKSFRSDYAFIHKKLKGQISMESIKESVKRLVDAGFLALDSEGKIKRSNSGVNLLEPEISKMAVREYQKQMAKKSLEALEDQKSEEIDFQGSTFCFQKQKMPELKKLVREFHQKALELCTQDGADEVYQLNTQFFRLV